MLDLRRTCTGCGGGMTFESRWLISVPARITGWHCQPCATVAERCGNMHVARKVAV